MNEERPHRSIPLRVFAYIVAVLIIMILFRRISAAQNNWADDGSANPGSTLDSGGSKAFKSYHDESTPAFVIRDPKMGCSRGLGERYTLQEQVEMGRSYAQVVERNSVFVSDLQITNYVNQLAQTLAHYSEAQFALTVKIIDTDEVNAFSLPGGFIFLDSGLILAADNEAELAGVISHEMAHVAACHAAQERAREDLVNIDSMPLILRIVFRRAVRNTVYLNPTRSFEYEADSLGLKYLYRAGYDPQALPSFFEKIRAIEKRNRGGGAGAFESHPQIGDRIGRTQHEINKLLPAVPEYKLDTPDFQHTKKRLSELESRNKLGEVGPATAQSFEVTKVQ